MGAASPAKRRKVADELDGKRLMRKEFELPAQAREEIRRRDGVEKRARSAKIRVK